MHGNFEVHAFTDGLPFRELKISKISDTELYKKISNARYNVLDSGRPIYCTAINPDTENRTEKNPHDSREGTVHIVTINKDKDIIGGLSVAVDIGEKSNGKLVGVPLEDAFRPKNYEEHIVYPEGENILNEFREKYVEKNRGIERSVKPWEMAELYRHFMEHAHQGDQASRLALYTGAYHLLVREARKNEKQPTDIWVFDAIPAYFTLYKYAGAAGLRDFTIKNDPEWISPSKQKVITRSNGEKVHYYNDVKISRNVLTPIPNKAGGKIEFKMKDVPFLDGVVDIQKCEQTIKDNPITFSHSHHSGFNLKDKIANRVAMGIIGYRHMKETHPKNLISNLVSSVAFDRVGAKSWDFNGVGDKGGFEYKKLEEELYKEVM